MLQNCNIHLQKGHSNLHNNVSYEVHSLHYCWKTCKVAIAHRKPENAPHARTSQVSTKWVHIRTSQLAIAHRKSCLGYFIFFSKYMIWPANAMVKGASSIIHIWLIFFSESSQKLSTMYQYFKTFSCRWDDIFGHYLGMKNCYDIYVVGMSIEKLFDMWRNDEMTKYYVICAAVSALSWLSQFCTSKKRLE